METHRQGELAFVEEKKKRLCSRFFIWKKIASHIEFGFKKVRLSRERPHFLFLFFELMGYFFLAGAFFKNEGTERFKIADGKGVFSRIMPLSFPSISTYRFLVSRIFVICRY